tara:strand:+ start:913 stop:1527 length:615 start_codon:yes stop_codon:yes gene_type:complete
MKPSDFIYVVDDALSEDFCKGVIEKFDKDLRKRPGEVGLGVNTKVKKSTDLQISMQEDWIPEHDVFAESLNNLTIQYDARNPIKEILPNPNSLLPSPLPYNLSIFGAGVFNTGFQLQKTKPGDYFHWHQDFSMCPRGPRVLTYMWYLNTLEEEDDGYTEFFDGTKVQPKVGRFLMFPACWTFYHRGFPPKKDKYISTGWVHSNP